MLFNPPHTTRFTSRLPDLRVLMQHPGIPPVVRQARPAIILVAAMIWAGSPSPAQITYGSANHTVTVQVSAITVMQVSSGSVNLNISAANAIAGQDQMSVVDQSTSLLWGTNSSARKITVRSNLAAPKFTLKLLAQSPSVGTPAPEVTLNSVSRDFLLNIGRSMGSCILRYTGVALASQGTGTDTHTITFTIQAQ